MSPHSPLLTPSNFGWPRVFLSQHGTPAPKNIASALSLHTQDAARSARPERRRERAPGQLLQTRSGVWRQRLSLPGLGRP